MFQPKKNIGKWDRLIRLTAGLGCLIYSYWNPWMVIPGVFAIYEAFSSWCVLYQFLGINTCPLKRK